MFYCPVCWQQTIFTWIVWTEAPSVCYVVFVMVGHLKSLSSNLSIYMFDLVGVKRQCIRQKLGPGMNSHTRDEKPQNSNQNRNIIGNPDPGLQQALRANPNIIWAATTANRPARIRRPPRVIYQPKPFRGQYKAKKWIKDTVSLVYIFICRQDRA